MRVLAIVPCLYDTAPGQRYRIEQWEPILRQHGVEITFVPFESKLLNQRLYEPGNIGRKARLVAQAFGRRAKILQNVRDFDVVYLYREAALIGPPLVELGVYRSHVPIVYDFDDAIFLPSSSEANRQLAWLKYPAKVRTLCSIAAHVMVGNPYLADYALQYNQNVSIVPSTIDMERYQFDTSQKSSEKPIIGWSGSITTIPYLETISSALQRLAKEEEFRFRFIGPCDWELDGVEVESVRWRSQTEAKDLSALDIGIMPLPDNQWTRGKCGMKALQYMALGIATVCSPVGFNEALIQDGKNGALAMTEDEWVDKLRQLLRSPQLRQQLGDAGLRTVQEEYTADVQAPRVLQIFRSAAFGEPYPPEELVHPSGQSEFSTAPTTL
jgi:glycosyltransferase involved in cell wall biosynthesis